jgi:hypothetical protein
LLGLQQQCAAERSEQTVAEAAGAVTASTLTLGTMASTIIVPSNAPILVMVRVVSSLPSV